MKTKIFTVLLCALCIGLIGCDKDKGNEPNIGNESGSAAVLSSAGRTSCGYVQLWENGPKWATFNVGATITDYANLQIGADARTLDDNKDQAPYYNTANVGGLYAWNNPNLNGRNDEWHSNVNTGIADIATTLWGSNWKTPTITQLQDLKDKNNTTWTWCNGITTQYVKGCILMGYKVSGKGDYANKSIFLPAAGYFFSKGTKVALVCDYGFYWSSRSTNLNILYFTSESYVGLIDYDCWEGLSVRPVLAE